MRRLAAAISALLIAAVLVAVLVGVARRYLLGAPLVWIDELTLVLFIWAIFWGAAFAVPLREHVAFDLVHHALPARWRQAVYRLACAAAAAAFVLALPQIVNFILFLWRERTPALQWRLDFVFACFALFVAAAALRFAFEALRRR
jgi:TRAP-type C4-dicarboxylate transport system permease small subunit